MKNNIETYEIWKDGDFFAGFYKGWPSRYGEPMNQEIMLKEFNSCIDYWTQKKVGHNWELRIHVNTRRKQV